MAVSSLSAMHLSLVVPLGMAPTLLGCPNFSLCNRVLPTRLRHFGARGPALLSHTPGFSSSWVDVGGPGVAVPGRLEYRLARMRARPAAAESDRHGVGAVPEIVSPCASLPVAFTCCNEEIASRADLPLFALSRKFGPVKEGHVLGHCVGSGTRRHRRTNKDPGLVACGNCSRKHEADDEVLRSGHSIFDWLELNEVVLFAVRPIDGVVAPRQRTQIPFQQHHHNLRVLTVHGTCPQALSTLCLSWKRLPLSPSLVPPKPRETTGQH